MIVDIALHRKQADSIVKSMLDPRNSVIYVLIYKMSMEEARWGAVYPNAFTPVLMIEGKCSRLRAKPAHVGAHLPDPLSALVTSFWVRDRLGSGESKQTGIWCWRTEEGVEIDQEIRCQFEGAGDMVDSLSCIVAHDEWILSKS
jgi:hypothetical protein